MMKKHEAATRIKEILGGLEGVSYERAKCGTSPAKRELAATRLKQLYARRKKLNEEIHATENIAWSYLHRLYRGSFEIAKGDTWEEVIEQLEARRDSNGCSDGRDDQNTANG